MRSQYKIELKLKAAHSPLQRVTNHARPRPAHVLSLAASIRLRRPAPPRARFRGRRLARFAHDPTALIVDVPRPEIIASLSLSALFACELIALRRGVLEELRRQTLGALSRSARLASGALDALLPVSPVLLPESGFGLDLATLGALLRRRARNLALQGGRGVVAA